MDYEIISELGHGMFGTVYKIKYKDTFYAMKIEHVLDKDKTKDLKSPIWREIDFSTTFSRKHKDQFMQMYYYDFIDNCEHIQKYSVDLKNFEKYHKDKINALAKSKICIRRIYELVDGNVKNIISQLSEQQIYSFIIQVSLIVKILEKAKYIHGDFHSGNIGYIKTDKKFIHYGKHKIPTYGYIYKAIDLGSVMHPKYKLSKRDKIWYKDLYGRELIAPLSNSVINFDKFWDFIEEYNIKLNLKKYLNKFEKSDLYKLIDLQFQDIENKEYKFNLAEILYPEQFQKIILGNKFKKTIVPILNIDIYDIIYLYKINFNSDKILEYFINKINIKKYI